MAFPVPQKLQTIVDEPCGDNQDLRTKTGSRTYQDEAGLTCLQTETLRQPEHDTEKVSAEGGGEGVGHAFTALQEGHFT
eukprot:1028109-Rhodomonas_salina.1